jgi:hypothetical protein
LFWHNTNKEIPPAQKKHSKVPAFLRGENSRTVATKKIGKILDKFVNFVNSKNKKKEKICQTFETTKLRKRKNKEKKRKAKTLRSLTEHLRY